MIKLLLTSTGTNVKEKIKNIIHLLVKKIDKKRAKIVINRIKPFLEKSNNIIDIGCGSGYISSILKSQGFDVMPVDVADFHGPRLVEPIIYNGKKLPFPNKSFDTALLLMVLHHTPDPEIVFSEAARVAKNIILVETSFTNSVNRFITIVADTLGNLRTKAFWKSYKSDTQWKAFFTKRGFKVVESHKYYDKNLPGLGVTFLHILYNLEKR